MKIEFADEDLRELCSTGKSKKNSYKKFIRDKNFMKALERVISALLFAGDTSQLRNWSWLKYERLTGNRSGYSSVRIMNGRVERLIFTEHEEGIRIIIIELNETHYGNKR